MLKSILTFIEYNLTSESNNDSKQHSIELATAALMFEISRADHHISTEEKSVIRDTLQKQFNLTQEELENLVTLAEKEAAEAVSLSDFSIILKNHLDYDERLSIVQNLWKVAFADNNLDKYEEYFIRKIADLLYISHSDYIRIKHRVLQDD